MAPDHAATVQACIHIYIAYLCTGEREGGFREEGRGRRAEQLSRKATTGRVWIRGLGYPGTQTQCTHDDLKTQIALRLEFARAGGGVPAHAMGGTPSLAASTILNGVSRSRSSGWTREGDWTTAGLSAASHRTQEQGSNTHNW